MAIIQNGTVTHELEARSFAEPAQAHGGNGKMRCGGRENFQKPGELGGRVGARRDFQNIRA